LPRARSISRNRRAFAPVDDRFPVTETGAAGTVSAVFVTCVKEYEHVGMGAIEALG
jgi:hypothetical protein